MCHQHIMGKLVAVNALECEIHFKEKIMEQAPSLNVFGEPLSVCSHQPKTGYFRDGCCNTSDQDVGIHTVCAVMTEAFLAFSLEQGNDLVTPVPEHGFSGLRPGDQWCLCAGRWWEAYQHNCAPKVILGSTHINTLDIVPIDILRQYALDLN